MLKVAVIGMGGIGNTHAPIYAANKDVELVAVCDIIKEKADAAAARYGVPAFYSVDDLLRGIEVDAVSVTTAGTENGGDHFQPVMQCLEAGKHVLGEKPISNEVEEAEEMVTRAKEKGLSYAINLNHRFTPAARLAKQWQEEGLIGHLLFINMSMWIMNPRETSPWFQLKALHPHTVDVMRYFGGDIEAVHCFATKAPGRQIWSTATFNMRFVNGAVGTLTGSYDIERGHPMERCEVAGTNGRFVIDDMYREVTYYGAGDPVKRVYSNPLFGGFRDFEDTFRDRIHTFLDEIERGVSPEQIEGSGAQGLAAQKVLAAAIESLETGSVVGVGN